MAQFDDARLAKAKEQLKEQSHVLNWFNELNESEKESLIKQTQNIHPESIDKTLNESLHLKPIAIQEVQQLPSYRQVSFKDLTEQHKESFFTIGLEAISKGEVAALALAGGQSSRLGADMPKGTYNLSIGFSKTDSLFYLQASQLCLLKRLAAKKFPGSKPTIPWLIMTSDSTYSQTKSHIDQIAAETGFPMQDILIFSQVEIPTVDFDGKLLLKNKGTIATNPNGNGGIYDALSKYLFSYEEKGVKFFHTYSVDNILNRVADPQFIGICISRNSDCAVKAIEKSDPHKSIGNICLVNGTVRVVEYSEITRELAERTDLAGRLFLRLGNIANHVFHISFLKRVCGFTSLPKAELPYHIAIKTVPYIDNKTGLLVRPTLKNAYKFESFLFDSFHYSQNFLVYEVLASNEFSPLKNSDDAGFDCLSTCKNDLAALHLKWIQEAGFEVDTKKLERINLKFFISPNITYNGENLSVEPLRSEIAQKLKFTLKNIENSNPKQLII